MVPPILNPSSPLSRAISRRRSVALRALEVCRGWGYREIEVPLLDYFDPLRRALDRRQVNRMFRFVDRDGNLLVLRADVTPAIAKIFAYQLSDEPLPLRLCYANKVVRIERAFTREQIETYQIGVELLGAGGLSPEVEVILIAVETLRTLGIDEFEINLGNVRLAERLVELTGLSRARREALMQAIGERDPHQVGELLSDSDAAGGLREAICALSSLSFEPTALDRLRRHAPEDPALSAAVDALHELLMLLGEIGLARHLHLDLGLTNEQGYYTGTAFKIVSERVGRILGGGGRYDELLGRFGRATPAVGFSFSLEALLEVLEPAAHGDDVLSSPAVAELDLGPDLAAGFREVLRMREQGLPTVIGHECDDED